MVTRSFSSDLLVNYPREITYSAIAAIMFAYGYRASESAGEITVRGAVLTVPAFVGIEGVPADRTDMLIGVAPLRFTDMGIPVSRSAKVAAEFLCLSSGRLIDGLAALQTGLSTGSRQIVPAAEGFHGVF